MDRKIYKKKPSICNCLNLRRASQAITEIYDESLAPGGLKLGQFSLLKHIKQQQPINVSDLALEMRLDRTTLVRNLKPMEEKGLVTDVAVKGTRNRQLKLTEAGLKAFNEAELLWVEAQSFIEQYLGKEDLSTLTGLLAKIEALRP